MAAPKKSPRRSRARKAPEGARPGPTRAQQAARTRLIRESGVVVTQEMLDELRRELMGA